MKQYQGHKAILSCKKKRGKLNSGKSGQMRHTWRNRKSERNKKWKQC